MSARKRDTKPSWIDPDDAPELTDEMFARARISIGGKIIREATGTVTKRGRPPVGDEPKQQVTLRLAPKVIRYFKETGEGWQTRLNETLEEYVVRASDSGKVRRSRTVSARPKRTGTNKRKSA
jgi:uncharacterized protein (DUF4415 family)